MPQIRLQSAPSDIVLGQSLGAAHRRSKTNRGTMKQAGVSLPNQSSLHLSRPAHTHLWDSSLIFSLSRARQLTLSKAARSFLLPLFTRLRGKKLSEKVSEQRSERECGRVGRQK